MTSIYMSYLTKVQIYRKRISRYIQSIKQAPKQIFLLYTAVIVLCVLEGLGILNSITSGDLRFILTIIVTILIPLAIAVFNDNEDIPRLDRGVILYHILNAKRLLIALIFMAIPALIWWDGINGYWTVLLLLLYITGLWWCWKTFQNSYFWMDRENRDNYRIDYFNSVKNIGGMQEYWKFIWNTKSENLKFEEMDKFINTFPNTIDSWLNKKDYDERSGAILSIMIQDFTTHVVQKPDKYNNIIWFTTILEKSLEWDFQAWKERKKKRSLKMTYLLRCRTSIHSCLRETERLLLGANPYIFFGGIKKHAEKHQEHKEYIGIFFDSFYGIFVEAIEKRSAGGHFTHTDIWDSFPGEWKVTKENIDNNEHISYIFYQKFMQWMFGRVVNSKQKEIDDTLNTVSENLFPTTDPILWADVLQFWVFKFAEKDNFDFKRFIEKPRTFGVMGRSISGFSTNRNKEERFEDLRQQTQQYERSTFELVFFLGDIAQFLSEEDISGYINDLKQLEQEYKEDEDKKRKVASWLYIFEEMLEVAKAQRSHKTS